MWANEGSNQEIRLNFAPRAGNLTYRIHGIIGESNIWRFALKMQLARLLFGDFEYTMERNPCLQPKWRNLIW